MHPFIYYLSIHGMTYFLESYVALFRWRELKKMTPESLPKLSEHTKRMFLQNTVVEIISPLLTTSLSLSLEGEGTSPILDRCHDRWGCQANGEDW